MTAFKGFIKRAYPFMVALSPALALFATNANELFFYQAYRSVVVLLGIGAILLIVLSLVFRSYKRAAIIFSAGHILFFLHGALRPLFEAVDFPVLFFRVGQDKALILCSLILLGLISLLAMSHAIADFLTSVFLRMASMMFFVPIFLIALYAIPQHWRVDIKSLESQGIEYRKVPDLLPDIYYIVLDGYGRGDAFQKYLDPQFSNHEFLEALNAKGFHVAKYSRSNYDQTQLSIASSLNFDYLSSSEMEICKIRIKNNQLFQFLNQFGYQTVSFSTGSSITNLNRVADQFVEAGLININAFERHLLNMTLLPYAANVILQSKRAVIAQLGALSPYWQHHYRVRNVLKELPLLAARNYPKVVFAHIIAPHPPYVFNRHGAVISEDKPFSFGDAEWEPQGYIDEVFYLNQLVLKAVDGILANSKRPPVIILQGDHGSGFIFSLLRDRANHTDEIIAKALDERFSILSAVYVPEKMAEPIADDISPVNLFRYLLNHFFDTQLKLLPNRSFTSALGDELVDITPLLDKGTGKLPA